MNMKPLAERLRLYLVIGSQDAPMGVLETVDAALRGGVTAVQLREKQATDRQILGLADRVGELCREHDALFVMNDRLDLALAVQANGVHLGVDDLPVSMTRRLAGSEFTIGFSPETDEQARSAGFEGASYLGVGPVFGTGSKSDAGPAIGPSLIRRRADVSGLPVVGIGGIDARNAAQVIQAGAVGVAVISAISRSPDPERAAAKLKAIVDANL